MQKIALATFILLVVTVSPAPAEQDFSPATRETDRAVSPATTRERTASVRGPVQVSIDFAPDDEDGREGVPQPATSDVRFFVSSVTFSGMRTFTPEELAFITDGYTGREIGAAEMNTLAKEIEMEYLRRGIVSVVFVPPQDIIDGTLRIQVMEPDER